VLCWQECADDAPDNPKRRAGVYERLLKPEALASYRNFVQTKRSTYLQSRKLYFNCAG
jgi:hypothetical protein